MTAPHIVDPARVLGNLLTEASPDIMRQLLQNMINALLSADADAVCGAEWGQPSSEMDPCCAWGLVGGASVASVTFAGSACCLTAKFAPHLET